MTITLGRVPGSAPSRPMDVASTTARAHDVRGKLIIAVAPEILVGSVPDDDSRYRIPGSAAVRVLDVAEILGLADAHGDVPEARGGHVVAAEAVRDARQQARETEPAIGVGVRRLVEQATERQDLHDRVDLDVGLGA